MKNQYFGDINDYRKYGLLRILAAGGKNKIAICWMLTADDSKSDGKFTTYLNSPYSWRPFDPDLFDFLSKTVAGKNKRDVASIARTNLVPSASYFSLFLADGNRDEYFERLHAHLRRSHILFFDPDNGLEIQSVPKERRGSHKYLYWDEAHRFFSKGHSLLIYQHFPRIQRERFIILRAADFFEKMGTKIVYSFRTSKVVFFLVPQRHHEQAIRSIAREVGRAWGGEIRPTEHHSPQ
jgi:hypothetical protein